MPDFHARPGRTAEAGLQQGLAGLAAMVARTEQVDDILSRVAALAVTAIPGVTGAGVTLAHFAADPVRIRAWAVTDAVVREIDEIQYEHVEEGPCLDAMRGRRPLVSGSLGSDPRWRRFGARVARLGVHSCLSLPLLVDGEVIGAINAYAHDRDAFGEHEIEVGMRFATPAAVSV